MLLHYEQYNSLTFIGRVQCEDIHTWSPLKLFSGFLIAEPQT